MLGLIIKIILLLVVLCGVILIYDARSLIKKFFGFGDQNEGAAGLKFFGVILVFVGGIVLFFVQRNFL